MGHPDGQNYAIWRGPDFAANPTFSLSASTPFNAQGLITNFASLILNFVCNAPNGASVAVNWFTDSTMLVPVSTMQWQLANGNTLYVIVPAIGNFVQVQITTTSVGASTCPVSAYPTNTVCETPKYYAVGNFVENGSLSIGAGATVTVMLPFISQGPGYAWIQDPGLTSKIQAEVVTLTEGGAFITNIVKWNTVSSFQAQQFVVPPCPVALQILNTDAVPHPVNYFLAADGR